MIFDDKLKLSDRQSLVGATAPSTVGSTNSVDLSAVVRDVGQGTPLYFHFHIDTGIVGGVDTTLQIALQFDVVNTFDSVFGMLIPFSHIMNFAAISAGLDIVLPLVQQPKIFSDLQPPHQFLRAAYVIGGTTTLSAGVVSMRATLDPVSYRKITADAVN